QLEPLLLEALDGVGPVCLDRFQHLLDELQELVVLRHGLGLAADGGDRADVPRDGRLYFAFRRRAPRFLAGRRHALLAQEPLRRLDVAAGLLERTLGVHHPRAGEVAELLYQARRDLHLAHSCTASVTGAGSGSGSGSSTVSPWLVF